MINIYIQNTHTGFIYIYIYTSKSPRDSRDQYDYNLTVLYVITNCKEHDFLVPNGYYFQDFVSFYIDTRNTHRKS